MTTDADRSEQPHVHEWVFHQNVTSSGYALPPYESCWCGAARNVHAGQTHTDAHDLTERAAHLARLGWAVEKHAARGEVEVRIDALRATAREMEDK